MVKSTTKKTKINFLDNINRDASRYKVFGILASEMLFCNQLTIVNGH